MLTTMSILSLDQGKLWREPPPAEETASADPEPEPTPLATRFERLEHRLAPPPAKLPFRKSGGAMIAATDPTP
jgi:hypothetical protein